MIDMAHDRNHWRTVRQHRDVLRRRTRSKVTSRTVINGRLESIFHCDQCSSFACHDRVFGYVLKAHFFQIGQERCSLLLHCARQVCNIDELGEEDRPCSLLGLLLSLCGFSCLFFCSAALTSVPELGVILHVIEHAVPTARFVAPLPSLPIPEVIDRLFLIILESATSPLDRLFGRVDGELVPLRLTRRLPGLVARRSFRFLSPRYRSYISPSIALSIFDRFFSLAPVP